MKRPEPEAYVVGLQPSMSWSYLLLECAYAFGKELDREEVGEPARYGSTFHYGLAHAYTYTTAAKPKTLEREIAKAAKKYGVAPDGILEHVRGAKDVLDRWLAKNEFRTNFTRGAGNTLFIEQAVALSPLQSGRAIAPHDESHRYRGLVLGEQPGTLDFSMVPNKRKLPVLVLDHKTGEEDFSRPLEKPQILSLGAAVMRWTGAKEAVLGVLHARRRGIPKVYAEKVTLDELAPHERRLQASLARIGDGSLRPGPWCRYCPAMGVCPAKDADLLSRAGDVLTGLTAAGGALSSEGLAANDLAIVKASPAAISVERKLGLLYEVVRKAEALAKRSREEIKAAIVESGGRLMPITPDKKYLVVREYEKETLSKQGLVEAYGKLGAERRLKKLRADGATTVTKVQQLWPEKER